MNQMIAEQTEAVCIRYALFQRDGADPFGPVGRGNQITLGLETRCATRTQAL